MALDANGNPVKAGDQVVLRCSVKEAGADTCDIETVYPAGDGSDNLLKGVPSGQLELVTAVIPSLLAHPSEKPLDTRPMIGGHPIG